MATDQTYTERFNEALAAAGGQFRGYGSNDQLLHGLRHLGASQVY